MIDPALSNNLAAAAISSGAATQGASAFFADVSGQDPRLTGSVYDMTMVFGSVVADPATADVCRMASFRNNMSKPSAILSCTVCGESIMSQPL